MAVVQGSSCRDRILEMLQTLEKREHGRFLAMAWAIWKIRNQRLFEEAPPPEHVVISSLIRMVVDYQSYADHVITRPRCVAEVGSNGWSPPMMGTIKINTDAYMAEDGSVGLGAVARDGNGTLLWLGCRRVRAEWDVEVAEAQATIFGLCLARERDLSNIAFESDALRLIMAVKRKECERTPFGLCVDDVRSLLNSFEMNVCSHVKRGGNTVAHCVARICETVGEERVFISDFPQGVISLAEIDLI
ncbi:uncharacterized protein LOC141588412 [Silene latifolia]|uniref:uncharacterized protein LOC141588412 n=1 Tax=Silene latifolia TaxID=37657 RepID=UPI003D773445